MAIDIIASDEGDAIDQLRRGLATLKHLSRLDPDQAEKVYQRYMDESDCGLGSYIPGRRRVTERFVSEELPSLIPEKKQAETIPPSREYGTAFPRIFDIWNSVSASSNVDYNNFIRNAQEMMDGTLESLTERLYLGRGDKNIFRKRLKTRIKDDDWTGYPSRDAVLKRLALFYEQHHDRVREYSQILMHGDDHTFEENRQDIIKQQERNQKWESLDILESLFFYLKLDQN